MMGVGYSVKVAWWSCGVLVIVLRGGVLAGRQWSVSNIIKVICRVGNTV